MPKGFNLRCAAGKTARVWLQGKGGGLKPGQAMVLLPPEAGETDESHTARRLVGFWREAILGDFQQQPGTKSRRIAGQIEITCGLSPKPEFIQSEQSVVVNGDGAFVVNNIRPQGHKDKLVDVLAGGLVFDPPVGVERVEWDPASRKWRSAWTRNDVVGTSMVPAMSSTSNVVLVNGYTKKDGWRSAGETDGRGGR